MTVEVRVEDHLDWERFAETYWNRRPVLYKSVATAPFEVGEVFAATASACAPVPGRAMPSGVQLTVEREQRRVGGGLLPTASDRDFDGYQRRVTTALAGSRYALTINAFHSHEWRLWHRERRFYRRLWEQVGIPLTSAITTMFHGTYEHSPIGVHKDRFATFMFGLKGDKRMRFWPVRPWTEDVSSVVDYAEYLPASTVVEVEPGDLLYWPSTYYHVGESGGGAPATSVNVGVPHDEHRAVYETQKLFVDVDRDVFTGATPLMTGMPAVPVALTATGPDADGLLSDAVPEPLRYAADVLAESLRDPRLEERINRASLNCVSAEGLEPVPPRRPRRAPADDDVVSAEPEVNPVWTDRGGSGLLVSVNGHLLTTSLEREQLVRLLRVLAAPAPVSTLLQTGDPAEVRSFLADLESRGGLRRDG